MSEKKNLLGNIAEVLTIAIAISYIPICIWMYHCILGHTHPLGAAVFLMSCVIPTISIAMPFLFWWLFRLFHRKSIKIKICVLLPLVLLLLLLDAKLTVALPALGCMYSVGSSD